VAEKEQTFKEKLEARQNIYGQSGNSKKIELALRESFAADKPKAEPVEWSVGEVVDNLPKSEPMPMPCENGKTKLLQGISKGGKPYYGHVCNCGKPKDQQCPAQWAKLSANGRWYFDGQENG